MMATYRDVDVKELEEEVRRLKLKVVSEHKMTSKCRRWFLDSKKTSNHGNANATARPKPTSVQEQFKAALVDSLWGKLSKLATKTKTKVLVDMMFNTDFYRFYCSVKKIIIVEARHFFH
jgi:predicted anti-sigma-YlaC factor YlaD